MGGRNVVLFGVSEAKNRWLEERMKALGIREEDLEERFVRSSGAGGQKVNKTSSCVYLKHLPSGIAVKCMKDRSQSVNRFLARRELLARIEGASGRLNADVTRQERLRKQKQRRRKRSQKKYAEAEQAVVGR